MASHNEFLCKKTGFLMIRAKWEEFAIKACVEGSKKNQFEL